MNSLQELILEKISSQQMKWNKLHLSSLEIELIA